MRWRQRTSGCCLWIYNSCQQHKRKFFILFCLLALFIFYLFLTGSLHATWMWFLYGFRPWANPPEYQSQYLSFHYFLCQFSLLFFPNFSRFICYFSLLFLFFFSNFLFFLRFCIFVNPSFFRHKIVIPNKNTENCSLYNWKPLQKRALVYDAIIFSHEVELLALR